jgi:hypothetical protein
MADAAAAIASTRSHVEAPSPEAKIASTDTTAAAKILNEHKLKAAAINILAILHDMASVRNMARQRGSLLQFSPRLPQSI